MPKRPLASVLPALAVAALAVAALAAANRNEGSWAQWGGPEANFQAPPVLLASDWGDAGPPVIWRRPLGDGNSAISVENDRLFTMHRDGESEVVVALDRASGETLWQHSWETPAWEGFYDEYGFGPHTTPLVVGDRLYATGIGGRLVCLDKTNGKPLWARELWEKFDRSKREFGPAQLGYSASPVWVDGKIVAVGGGPDHSVVALDPEDGSVVWSAAEELEPGFASPLLIDLAGQKQLVIFAADRVAGLDPADGKLLWQTPHETPYLVNASTPLWDGESTLFVSSAYDAGSRALQLSRRGESTEVKVLWTSRELEVHHQTSVWVGDRIYASSGDFGPAFLTALDPADGKLLFKDRGFAKSNLLAVGETLVILDEDGVLALGKAGAEGVEILAKAEIFKSRSWTVPTLVGSTLYARDRKEIAAFDLGPSG